MKALPRAPHHLLSDFGLKKRGLLKERRKRFLFRNQVREKHFREGCKGGDQMSFVCFFRRKKKLCNSKQSCGMAAAKVTANFY